MNDYYKNTQNAINFIEENILSNIALEDVASASRFSLYHFYRIFNTLTGMTIKEYVRLRRLSMAAMDLRDTNDSIIDIAVKYGFGSQEAFSRAFNNTFSIMPGEYRKKKNPIPLLLKVDLIKPLTHITGDGNNSNSSDDLRIYYIHKPPRKIIAKINPNPNDIHEFYGKCERNGDFGTLVSINEGIFGPFGCWITHPKFTHLIGVEVEPDYYGEIPGGMETVEVNGSQYVVFNHIKHNSELHDQVIKDVWKTSENWKPEDYGLEWNFENAPTYEDDNDELGYFVYKPVRDKAADKI